MRLWFLHVLITGRSEPIVSRGDMSGDLGGQMCSILLLITRDFPECIIHKILWIWNYWDYPFFKIIPITILHNKLKSKPTVTHTHSHTQISWFSTIFWKFCFQIFLQDLVLNIFIAKMYSCVDNISKISSLKHWF